VLDMKKVTATRLKELSSYGYMSNITKIAQALTQIIDNAYDEYSNDYTYFINASKTYLQIEPQTENQLCTLNGMSVNFPELVTVTFTHDLNHAYIKDVDKLVREYYKMVTI